SAKVGDHSIDHAVVPAAAAAGATRKIKYRARPLAGWAAANLAVQGIAGALRVREQTGLGQQVETSLYQGLQIYGSHVLVRQQELGLIAAVPAGGARRPGQGRPKLRLHTLVVRCKDGRWLQVTCVAARLFPNWMKTIGLGHIYDDERFKGAPYRFQTLEDEAELRRL